MTLKELQNEVHEWISRYGGYWPPLSMLARLTEETGELARELNHTYGTKKKKPEETTKPISGEMGDILITLMCIANALDIDLDASFRKTMDKIQQRDKDRTK